MNQMIILEGPDGGGKSTLATWLSQRWGWPIVHTGGPLTSREDFISRVADLNLLDPPFSMIVDRTPFISDRVYSIVNPNPPVTTEEDFQKMMIRVRPIIIYCRLADPARMLSLVSKAAKSHKPAEYLDRVQAKHSLIVQNYDRIMAPIHHLTFDWERDDRGTLVGKILEELERCAG